MVHTLLHLTWLNAPFLKLFKRGTTQFTNDIWLPKVVSNISFKKEKINKVFEQCNRLFSADVFGFEAIFQKMNLFSLNASQNYFHTACIGGFININIVTGDMSPAIAPFHFFGYFK